MGFTEGDRELLAGFRTKTHRSRTLGFLQQQGGGEQRNQGEEGRFRNSRMSRLKKASESEWKMVPAPEQKLASPSPAEPSTAATNALVEYSKPALREEEEDLEVKLRRIIDHVPVRVSNTSGSSAGSGSGDFHQYRQMRRKEQDRLSRMEVDYQKRKAEAEFNMRREERLRAAEERTAKKRQKRQKKKQKRREKKNSSDVKEEPSTAGGDESSDGNSEDDDDSK